MEAYGTIRTNDYHDDPPILHTKCNRIDIKKDWQHCQADDKKWHVDMSEALAT